MRTPSTHMSSVIELSSGGTKCERTSVFTPAAAASLPRSSVTMWLASRCSRSVAALGGGVGCLWGGRRGRGGGVSRPRGAPRRGGGGGVGGGWGGGGGEGGRR